MPRPKIALVHATLRAVEPAHALLAGFDHVDVIQTRLLELAEQPDAARALFRETLEEAAALEPAAILTTCSMFTRELPALRPDLAVPVLAIDEPLIEHAAEARRPLVLVGSIETAVARTAAAIEARNPAAEIAERIVVEPDIPPAELAPRLERFAASGKAVVIVQLSLNAARDQVAEPLREAVLTGASTVLPALRRLVQKNPVAFPVALPEAKADRVLAWRGEFAETLPALAELGYDGVELMVRDPAALDGERVADQLAAHGMKLAAAGTGPIGNERGLSLSAADAGVRGEAIEAAQAALELCGPSGAMITIGGLRGRCEPAEVPAARRRFSQSLAALAETAEKTGARIALEPQNRFQSSFFRTVAETMEAIEALGAPTVGLSIDAFHMNIEESSLAEACATGSERIFYVQLADNQRRAPGTGMFDFAALFDELDRLGYAGWLTLETGQARDGAAAARAALEGLRGLDR